MSKIGILGGTFNPIHNGHLLLAEWALETAELDEIWFIPTGSSYMKRNMKILSGEERLNLVKLAIQDNQKFQCLDIEINRVGNTYTYETLVELREKYPNNDYYFITGTDCLYEIENWYKPELIFANCTMLVATREDADITDMNQKKKELQDKFGARIIIGQFLNIPISSTLIRERIQDNKSVRYLMPDHEYFYIKEKGFFK